jgi:hypothetical protein
MPQTPKCSLSYVPASTAALVAPNVIQFVGRLTQQSGQSCDSGWTQPKLWSRVPLVPAALRLQVFSRNQVNANVRVLRTDKTPIQWFPNCEPGPPRGGWARLFEGHENSRSFAASLALLACVSFIRYIIIIVIIIIAATWIHLQMCDIIKVFQTLCILSIIGA